MTDTGLLAETKTILRSLTISAPNSLTIAELQKEYYDIEGRKIPFGSLGYSNLETFLRSLRDTITIDNFGNIRPVLVKESEHIRDLVTKSKNSKRPRRRNVVSDRFYFANHCQNRTNDRPPLFQTPFSNQASTYTMQSQFPPFNHQPILQLATQLSLRNMQCHPLLGRINAMNRNMNYNNQFYRSPPPPHFRKQYNTNKNYCKKPIVTNPKKYETLVNNIEYSDEDCRSVKPKNCDTSSVLRPKSPPPYIETPAKATSPVKHIPEDKSSDTAPLELPDPTISKPISDAPASKFRKPLVENIDVQTYFNLISPHAVEQKNIADITLNNFDISAQLNELQINKSNNLKNISNDSVSMSKISSNDNRESYDDHETINLSYSNVQNKICNTMMKEDTDNEEDELDALPDLCDNDPIFQVDIPKNVSKIGNSILPSIIPADIKEESEFPIFIAEVHDPSKLWFHFFDTSDILDNLMNDLEIFYEQLNDNELRIDTNLIRKGQICCAIFHNMWHRAEIVGEINKDMVKVFFVDYGTTSSVYIRNIKYLMSDFSGLRSQVYRGSLSYIRPIGHRWSRDATYFLLNVVAELMIFAKATNIDRENNVISMLLIDTNTETDLHINNELIKRGHAQLYTEMIKKEQV